MKTSLACTFAPPVSATGAVVGTGASVGGTSVGTAVGGGGSVGAIVAGASVGAGTSVGFGASVGAAVGGTAVGSGAGASVGFSATTAGFCTSAAGAVVGAGGGDPPHALNRILIAANAARIRFILTGARKCLFDILFEFIERL